MKKLRKLVIVIAAMLTVMAALPVMAKTTAPSVAKTSYVYFVNNYGGWDLDGYITIKNVSKSAKVSSVKISKSGNGYAAIVLKDAKTKKPEINIYYSGDYDENGNFITDLRETSFKLSFKVKQNGKTTKLSTIVKIKAYQAKKAFKSIKVNGKNVLSQYKNGIGYITMKLAGKHPSITFATKKPFLKDNIYVQRNNKMLTYKKAGKLKKGDIIQIVYHNKTDAKGRSYQIVVK